MPRVAVLCWEECRPWVSALRQNGYSVPWVEEPKGEAHRQVPGVEPDAVVVDLTRRPEQGKEILLDLAGRRELKDTPFIAVTEKPGVLRGVRSKVANLSVTGPDNLIAAVKAALGE